MGVLGGQPQEGDKFLNLFAYTGGASLAARQVGADVIHCDAIRQVVDWTRKNMERSGLDGIRWVVEDAMKFARREAKRGNTYQGIVLDPPTWGLGPKGEKWKLEDQLLELIDVVASLVAPGGRPKALVMNTYSGIPTLAFCALALETMWSLALPDAAIEAGELCLRGGGRPRFVHRIDGPSHPKRMTSQPRWFTLLATALLSLGTLPQRSRRRPNPALRAAGLPRTGFDPHDHRHPAIQRRRLRLALAVDGAGRRGHPA